MWAARGRRSPTGSFGGWRRQRRRERGAWERIGRWLIALGLGFALWGAFAACVEVGQLRDEADFVFFVWTTVAGGALLVAGLLLVVAARLVRWSRQSGSLPGTRSRGRTAPQPH